MEPTSTVSSPVDALARLSYAQKRDLLGQTVAAVLTTALIAAPLITPPDSGDARPLASLPAVSFAAPVAAVAVADVTPPRAPHEWTRTTTVGRKLRSRRFDSLTLTPVGVEPQPVQAAVYAKPRKPLSRRLTGWLTGNGAHAVRPFPTVLAPRS